MADRAAAEAGNFKPNLIRSVFAALLLSLVCGGTGFLAGHLMRKSEKTAPAAAQAIGEAMPAVKSPLKLLPLPTVVTNLAGGNKWIRLEASVLIDNNDQLPPGLSAQLADDVALFVRTIALDQISSPSGFQHFREDLVDRLGARTSGGLKDLTFQSIVIE